MSQSRQPLPGNVSVRRGRMRRQTFSGRRRRSFQFRPKPWMVPALFGLVIFVGAFILSLPISAE
jgi:hypothetical protein